MNVDRRIVAIAAAIVVALAALGAGIAQAVSRGEESVTGPAARQARDAALAAVEGGTVLEVERQDGDGPGVYEVEVRRPDGSEVEIQLDARFQVLGSASDDDGASGGGVESEPDTDD